MSKAFIFILALSPPPPSQIFRRRRRASSMRELCHFTLRMVSLIGLESPFCGMVCVFNRPSVQTSVALAAVRQRRFAAAAAGARIFLQNVSALQSVERQVDHGTSSGSPYISVVY